MSRAAASPAETANRRQLVGQVTLQAPHPASSLLRLTAHVGARARLPPRSALLPWQDRQAGRAAPSTRRARSPGRRPPRTEWLRPRAPPHCSSPPPALPWSFPPEFLSSADLR